MGISIYIDGGEFAEILQNMDCSDVRDFGEELGHAITNADLESLLQGLFEAIDAEDLPGILKQLNDEIVARAERAADEPAPPAAEAAE
jgi:hypothetical protein